MNLKKKQEIHVNATVLTDVGTINVDGVGPIHIVTAGPQHVKVKLTSNLINLTLTFLKLYKIKRNIYFFCFFFVWTLVSVG
jgi:hypothetical protein